jgi:hypothetical protein
MLVFVKHGHGLKSDDLERTELEAALRTSYPRQTYSGPAHQHTSWPKLVIKQKESCAEHLA